MVSKHDRSQFFKDLSAPFFGANRAENRATQGMRDAFWLQGMQCGMKGAMDCIKAFSETDFTEDLKESSSRTRRSRSTRARRMD
jgi:non-heme chloroperoxidase